MNLKLTGMALAVAFAFATAAQAQMTQTPAGKADPAKPRTEQTTPRADDSQRKAKNDEEQRIESTAKADKAKCQPMSGNAKDICMAEAKAKEKIAKAELDAKYDNTPRNQRKVEEMKAEGAYEVAKQKCDDQKGEAKDACMKQAKATHDQARAQAKAKYADKERPAAGGTAPVTGQTSPEKPKKSN